MTNLDYLYNPDAAKNSFNKNYFVDKKLGFTVIEHGTILPHRNTIKGQPKRYPGFGGIIDGNGEFVVSSLIRYGEGSYYTPPPESIQHSSETVVYLGMFHDVWGHFVTDHVRRLWFLKSDYFHHEFKDCPLVYIPYTNFSFESQRNYKRLLEVLEVDVDRLQPITQSTQFDKIILPDESYRFSFVKDHPSFFTDGYRETINRIRDFALKNRTPTANKKIYYFYGRYQFGEERLAEYFKSKDYAVIRPETLTLDEQFNLLINCESFASTLGSISHNSLFLRDGTETIFLTRAVNCFTGCQNILNQVHPVNVNYVDSTLSIFAQGVPRANCFIISPQLKRFFGDKWDGYEEEDFKTFLQYVKNNLGKSNAINPKAKELYGEILSDFMSQLKQREDFITAYNMPTRWETFQPISGYQTHVSMKGWGAWQSDNQISGSTKDKFNIQAVRINFPNHKVYYAVYYNAEEGWSQEVSDGEQAGTTGKSKPICGIRIRLDEADAKEFDVLYRVHTFDNGWTPWAKNGAELLSNSVKLNALQIKLEPKAAS